VGRRSHSGDGAFNLTNGAIGTATSLGASLSHVVSGLIVQHLGYDVRSALSAVASIALGVSGSRCRRRAMHDARWPAVTRGRHAPQGHSRAGHG